MALSRKQMLFVRCFRGDPLEAAIRAGYSKQQAPISAKENMENPDILRAIEATKDDPDSMADFDPSMPIGDLPDLIKSRLARQVYWASIMTGKYETTNERLKASELLARSCGDFADPSSPAGSNTPPPTVIVIKAGKDPVKVESGKQLPIEEKHD